MISKSSAEEPSPINIHEYSSTSSSLGSDNFSIIYSLTSSSNISVVKVIIDSIITMAAIATIQNINKL